MEPRSSGFEQVDCAEHDVWMSSSGSKLSPVVAKRWLTLLRMASLADLGRVRSDIGDGSGKVPESPESVIVGLTTILVLVYTKTFKFHEVAPKTRTRVE